MSAEDAARHGSNWPSDLDAILAGDIDEAWRVSLFTNLYFAPIFQEFEHRQDITQPEFSILYCCSIIPGITANRIIRLSGRAQNSISRGVTRLTRDGLLEKRQISSDRRAKNLFLTDAGQQKLIPLIEVYRARQEKLFSSIPDDDRDRLRELLDRLLISAMADIASGSG